MKQIKNRRFNLLLPLIALAVAVFFGWLIYSQSTQLFGMAKHVSKDLRISLSYPRGWYIDDRYRTILVTNYETNLNKDTTPNKQQIEIQINNDPLCQKSTEEDLIFGGCGEGQKVLNKILNKKNKKLSSGTLQVFRVQYPDSSEKTVYYLQNKNRILQISKRPDPSQYEKEFEKIVNSIRFQ